jgi:hypothetical protein
VSGRWKTSNQLGNAVAVDLAIEATGAPTPVDEAWGCRGAFARIPVRLEGTLTLRTGTRFFNTIRRARLAGFVIVDQGAVNCDRPQPSECAASSSFWAGTAKSSVVAAPRSIVLQFRDPVAQSPAGAAWYHVMTIDGTTPSRATCPSSVSVSPRRARSAGTRGSSPARRPNRAQAPA